MSDILAINEMILAIHRGELKLKPITTPAGRLFQARMWREYAKDWDRPLWHLRRGWVEKVLRHSREDCLRRARINVYLARRLNRNRP